ncbi:MAG TPA: hypothetical protein VLU41_06965 [Ideonella sp.]|nr:hypothetical protein [Ideonella sp.]
MSRYRDTEDWRSTGAESRRSTDFDSTGFDATSGYRSARPARRRHSFGVGWLIFIVAFLLALAGAVVTLLPSWLRR